MKKTFEINLQGHPAEVKIVDGYAVLAIPLDYFKNLVESDERYSDYDENSEEFKFAKVNDTEEWACDVVSALNQEDEDGSTLITKAIEEALNLAIEDGSEAINLPMEDWQ